MSDVGINNTAPVAHSPIGGSTAGRIIACPGSLPLVLEVNPPNTSSGAADLGTMVHDALAKVMLGEEVPDGFEAAGVTLTEEIGRDIITPCLDAFDELENKFGEIEYEVETQVTFPGIDGAFGTADVIGRSGNRVFVVDWKTGFIPVPASSPQLMFYAAAARNTPATADLFDGAETVVLAIIQPQDGGLKYQELPVRQLDVFVQTLHDAVNDPDPQFRDGDHCTFCPVKLQCPLKRRKTTDMALRLASVASKSAVTNVEELTVEDLPRADLSSADLADLMAALEGFEVYRKALHAEAHDRLTRGVPVPGYKLVAKQSRRAWVDDGKAMTRLKNWKIPKAEYTKSVLLSPAQIDKVLKAKDIDPKRIADLCPAESSGTNVVKEIAGAPAIAPLAQRLAQVGKQSNE